MRSPARKRLARHLLAHRQHRLGTTQVDDDAAALKAPHDARDQLALLFAVLVEHVVAFGFAHPLQDDLLGGLRGEATEGLPGPVELEQGPVLGVLFLGPRLILLIEEDLKQQLVAHVGLQVELLGFVERDLLGRNGHRVGHNDDLETDRPVPWRR